MNVKVCNRCGSYTDVEIDNRCTMCGPVWLCPLCYEAHVPNVLVHIRPAPPAGAWD